MSSKYEEAINCFHRVIELDPKYEGVYKRTAAALLAIGKPEEAIGHLQKSLQINPNDAGVYISISVAYIKSGNYDLAAENWTRAKQSGPKGVEPYNNPAWLLVTAGDASTEDINNATIFALRECEKTGYSEPRMLDTLAAAYAAAGRFDEAVKTAQKAADAARAQGQEGLADEIQKRLEPYRAGQCYIQK
jgi:spermidine synthase